MHGVKEEHRVGESQHSLGSICDGLQRAEQSSRTSASRQLARRMSSFGRIAPRVLGAAMLPCFVFDIRGSTTERTLCVSATPELTSNGLGQAILLQKLMTTSLTWPRWCIRERPPGPAYRPASSKAIAYR
jgi:hypothetical protein